MCKNYFSVRIFLARWHIWRMQVTERMTQRVKRADRCCCNDSIIFFYRFTHATSYNMSIILRCWYVAVLITFSYAMFLWIFSLIIHVTWLCQSIDCFFLLARSFLSQLNLLVLFSNNQWINIFKFIPNSIDFHSIRVTRCRCCRSPVVW